jgi:hypothetical protein
MGLLSDRTDSSVLIDREGGRTALDSSCASGGHMRTSPFQIRPLVIVVVAGAVAGCGDLPRASTAEEAAQVPQLSFPMQFWTQCQSEVCYPGTWGACERLAVREAPGLTGDPAGWIEAGDRFRVDGANTLVLRPGLVRVSERTEQRRLGGSREVYRAGDTILVLDYRGEGSFTTWHDGGLALTEMFWPSPRASLPEYTGELIQEPEQERWLRVETGEGLRGWLKDDAEQMRGPLVGDRAPSC